MLSCWFGQEVFSVRRSSLAGRAGLYTVPQPFNLSTKARNKQRDARAQVTRLRKSACAKEGCARADEVVCGVNCAQVVRGLGRHLELQEAAKRQKQMQREREQVHTTPRTPTAARSSSNPS